MLRDCVNLCRCLGVERSIDRIIRSSTINDRGVLSDRSLWSDEICHVASVRPPAAHAHLHSEAKVVASASSRSKKEPKGVMAQPESGSSVPARHIKR